MALPTASDLLGLDYSFCGEPYCVVCPSASLQLSEMDISFLGEPFGWLEGTVYLPLTEADITYLGEPFIWIVSNASIDTSGMDYSYLAEPYVVNYGWGGGTPATYIKVNTVSWSSIKKLFKTATSAIKKIMGVSPT